MKRKWIALLVVLVLLTGTASALAETNSKTTDDMTRIVAIETQKGKPGAALICESCGFQAATAVTVGEAKALAISASDVLTVFTSDNCMPLSVNARASR